MKDFYIIIFQVKKSLSLIFGECLKWWKIFSQIHFMKLEHYFVIVAGKSFLYCKMSICWNFVLTFELVSDLLIIRVSRKCRIFVCWALAHHECSVPIRENFKGNARVYHASIGLQVFIIFNWKQSMPISSIKILKPMMHHDLEVFQQCQLVNLWIIFIR